MFTRDPIVDVAQADLFADSIEPDEVARSRDQVSTLVAEMTKGLSRDRVADDMTALGCRTSTAMINAWASPARSGHNLPFYAAAPLEIACSSTELTDLLVTLRNGVAFYGEDALLHEVAAELAELEANRAYFSRQINAIRRKMGKR